MQNPTVASSRITASIAIAVATTLTIGSSARAAALTWDANGVAAAQTDGAGSWLTANQWWNGTTNTNWTSGDDAVFGNGGAGGAVNLGSATAAQTITFNSFTGTYTLGTAANALTINGGITMNAGAGAVNIVSPITLGGAQSWTNNSSSTLTLTSSAAGALTLGSNLLTLNGGAFNFVYTSPSTTTGSGGVRITAGSTVTNSSTQNPFGTGTLELNSGSITNSTTATVRTITNAVSLTGDFILGSGGGSGSNTFTGALATTGNRVLTVNTALAIFNNATAVSLAGNLSVNGSGGIQLSGAGGITGSGNITISTTGALSSQLGTGPIGISGTITNNGTGTNTTTISGVIGASVTGITQNSATSSLTLSGANTAYAGTTTLTSGTLRANGAASNTFTAFGTSSLVLDGGTLQLRSNGASNGNQTIVAGNNMTIGSNAVTVDVNNNGGNSNNNITLGNLSLGTGQLNVTGGNGYTFRIGGTTTMTGNVTVNPTTGNLTLAGIIGDGGNGFSLTKIGSGTLTLGGSHTYTGTTSILAGTVTLAAPATNGSAGSLGNATSAVLLGDTTGSANVILQSAQTAVTSIARNMIAQSGNTGVVTIFGNPSSNFNTNTISGNIQLGSTGGTGHGVTVGTAGNNTATFSGIISDPASLSGAAAPVTVSSGTVVLSGANTFAGGLIINGGTARLNNNTGAGTGIITINGGSLGGPGFGGPANITFANDQIWNAAFSPATAAGAGGFTSTGNISLTTNIILSMDNAQYISTGVISDSVAGANNMLAFRNNGTNGGSGWTLNGANTFGGGVLVVGGATNGTTQNAVLGAGGTSGTALGTGRATLSNSTKSILNILTNQTIDSLSSAINHPTFVAGTGGTNGTQALVFTGGGGTGAAGTATISGGAITAITITSYGQDYTSAPTITVNNGGSGTVTSTFGSSSIAIGNKTLTLAGTNASPATYAGVISGTGGSLVKNGAGTQILTGINTYTGATTINDGTLALGATGSINNTSGISLGTGGTFDVSAKGVGGYTVNNLTGSGDVIGSLTVTTQLAIGNSPGTTSFDSLTLGAASSFNYELTGGISPDAGSADLGIVSGDLTITSGALLDLFQLGDYTANNKFTLFAYMGTLTGTFTGLADGSSFTDAGGLWQIDYNDTSAGLNGGTTIGASYVTITAVPEPAAALLGGLGLLALLRRRR